MRSLKRAQRPILGDNYEQKPSKNANLQDESYKIRMILQPTFHFFLSFFFFRIASLPRVVEKKLGTNTEERLWLFVHHGGVISL